MRAYKIATTPPMGPVLLSLDAELQENPIHESEKLRIPKLSKVIPPQADAGAIAEAAKLLVNAEAPLIVVDRMARTAAGMTGLVALAETLQCAVMDRFGRTNFPSRHPLNQTFRRNAVVGQADVILAIEMNDHWGALNAFSDRIVRSIAPAVTSRPRRSSRSASRLVTSRPTSRTSGAISRLDWPITGDGEA